MSKPFTWLIVNGYGQPLYSPDTKRLWLFFTEQAAIDFLKKVWDKRGIDPKTGKPRIRKIVKVFMTKDYRLVGL